MKWLFYLMSFIFICLDWYVLSHIQYVFSRLDSYHPLPFYITYLLYPLAIYLLLQGIFFSVTSFKTKQCRFIFTSIASVVLSLFISFFILTLALRLHYEQSHELNRIYAEKLQIQKEEWLQRIRQEKEERSKRTQQEKEET